ncbi:MAG: ABC transporter substrate-binding protein, partial [Pseudoalteromonas sp.]
GIEHRLICPQKYGINVYSDILYTTQSVLAANPQMVEKFYKASLKGWRYAMMHLEESIAITAEKYATHKSINELTNEAEVLSDYILPPDTKLGAMSMPKWRLIADLYNLEAGSFDKVKAGFIYHYDVPEEMELSWMLIAAIALSILFLPLYLRLMFKKSV